jgi:hypothetical protein
MKIHRIGKMSYWTPCRFKIGYQNKPNVLSDGGAHYIWLGFIMLAFDYGYCAYCDD